jgi:hypothetical protein
VPLAREGEQVADDTRGTIGFAEDRVDALPGLRIEITFREPLGQVRMVASGLFNSWATPEMVVPRAAIFSAWSSW